jgi:hypothetical protein
MRLLTRIAPVVVLLPLQFAPQGRAENPPAAPVAAPQADLAPSPPLAPTQATAPRTVLLHANSLIPLQLLETVGSDTHTTGATFALEVSEDVTVDGVVVIPAGSKVEGQIIHAARSGMLGKPGELIVTSRFVMVGERKVKLRSLISGTGQSRADLAFVIWPFVKGKKVIIPADTELVAKIAQDETFAVPPASGPGL